MKTVSEEVKFGGQVTVLENDGKCAVSSCAHVKTDDDKDGYMLAGAFMTGGGETKANKAEKENAKDEKQNAKEDKEAQDLCKKHPNWKMDDCRQVARKQVEPGMTRQMVPESWGKARGGISRNVYADGHSAEFWDYNSAFQCMMNITRCATVFLVDGVVTAVNVTTP